MTGWSQRGQEESFGRWSWRVVRASRRTLRATTVLAYLFESWGLDKSSHSSQRDTHHIFCATKHTHLKPQGLPRDQLTRFCRV